MKLSKQNKKKKLKSFFTKSFKISRNFLLLFLLISFMARFHDIWEIWIKDKLSTKSKSETIGAFLYFNNCNQIKYYFQTNLKEHCHLWKIDLNFGFLSPTKYVNHFSFFENLVINLREEHPISNKTTPNTGSFFLTFIHATLQNF